MSLAAVVSPYQPINGLTGLGLNDGALYIGIDGQDPETNPQTCYWDAGGTIAAVQPIQILGGYPMRLGTPTRLYTATTYSIRVRDAQGQQVFYEASAVPAQTATQGFFSSLAAAQASSISAAVQVTGLLLLGYTTAGDGGGAQYRYATVQATGLGKFRSVDGAWWELAEPVVDVMMFGAIPDGATDNSTAIQNAINYVSAHGGGRVWFRKAGVYIYATTLTIGSDNLFLAGQGGQHDLACELRYTGAAQAMFIGPGLGTPDAAHFNDVGLENIAVTSIGASSAGVRCDNCALHLTGVYVKAHGGLGIWVSRGWASVFTATTSQANANDNWFLEDGCNAINMTSCGGLSTPGHAGLTISGGSRGCSNITLTAFDGEGCLYGLYLNTATGNISGLVVIAPNFEGNLAYAVTQTNTGNLVHAQFVGGQFYNANNGILLWNVYAAEFHSPKLYNCNLDISGNKDALIFQPRLEGTATVNAGVVVSNLLGAYPDGSIALGASGDTFRYPLRIHRGGAWRVMKEVSGFDVNVVTNGAAVQNLDLSLAADFNLYVTTALTASIALTVSNDALARNDELRIAIENDGGSAAGAVTFPAAFKTASAVAIPAANKKLTVTFEKDGNGLYWEVGRATAG